ncbi:hypothetical protein GOB93_03165 [Acetobacter musti]|uniref:CopG family transcriptional regulator n=1 Tax=Acetobacter musti TaxID=864732 RepID=A0ABX0JJU9_9PROT|nr:hypothetical protein [Acetobacter musti]NHN83639.1 hypothetical protein [Acetobacter musti]
MRVMTDDLHTGPQASAPLSSGVIAETTCVLKSSLRRAQSLARLQRVIADILVNGRYGAAAQLELNKAYVAADQAIEAERAEIFSMAQSKSRGQQCALQS